VQLLRSHFIFPLQFQLVYERANGVGIRDFNDFENRPNLFPANEPGPDFKETVHDSGQQGRQLPIPRGNDGDLLAPSSCRGDKLPNCLNEQVELLRQFGVIEKEFKEMIEPGIL